MSSPAGKWRMEGQTALVTGGTKGIGLATVKELLALGASKVFLCSRTKEEVEQTVAQLKAQGFHVAGTACDVSDPAQCRELIQAVNAEFGGKLNHLINNVGTNIRKPTADYSEEDFHKIITTNLESAYRLCQLARPLLTSAANSSPSEPSGAEKELPGQQTRANASIVFNSSVAGIVAIRSGSLYAMTKAALNHLTRYLACEWAKDGIRVNSVAPWYTHTDLANQVLNDVAFKGDVISRTPMRRCAEPEEVASAIAFFCLGAASYVTGQILAVDGGFTVSGFFPLQD